MSFSDCHAEGGAVFTLENLGHFFGYAQVDVRQPEQLQHSEQRLHQHDGVPLVLLLPRSARVLVHLGLLDEKAIVDDAHPLPAHLVRTGLERVDVLASDASPVSAPGQERLLDDRLPLVAHACIYPAAELSWVPVCPELTRDWSSASKLQVYLQQQGR